MNITDDNYQVFAENQLDKLTLLSHARAAGVPVAPWALDATDADMFISYFGPSVGLATLPKRITSRNVTLLSGQEFIGLCEAARTATPQLVAA